MDGPIVQLLLAGQVRVDQLADPRATVREPGHHRQIDKKVSVIHSTLWILIPYLIISVGLPEAVRVSTSCLTCVGNFKIKTGVTLARPSHTRLCHKMSSI